MVDFYEGKVDLAMEMLISIVLSFLTAELEKRRCLPDADFLPLSSGGFVPMFIGGRSLAPFPDGRLRFDSQTNA